MKISKRKLEVAMANACLNSKDLATKANLPRPTLNNAITGRNVRPMTVGRIAKALQVPVESLVDM